MDDLDLIKGGRRGAEPPAEVEFSQEEIKEIDDMEIEKKPRPKKVITEKQKEKGLENLKKGREILMLKRQQQRELREKQRKEKDELKQRKDFKKDESKVEPKVEPKDEPKTAGYDADVEIEEHIKIKPKKKKIIYREESDDEEEIIVKRKPKEKKVLNTPVIPPIQFF